jgi:hypothetical protein
MPIHVRLVSKTLVTLFIPRQAWPPQEIYILHREHVKLVSFPTINFCVEYVKHMLIHVANRPKLTAVFRIRRRCHA